MSSSLPERPSFLNRLHEQHKLVNHIAPYGPKPRGKLASYTHIAKQHSREGHRLRSETRQTALRYITEQRQEAHAKRFDKPKLTLEQRLAAIPPATYTPIAPKSILIDFEKHTPADLARIFAPKFTATLKRLNVFETLELDDICN